MKEVKLALIIISINPSSKDIPNVLVSADDKIPISPLSALTIRDQLAILYKDSLQVKDIHNNWLQFELKDVIEDSEAIYLVYKIYFPWIMKLKSDTCKWRSIYEIGIVEDNKKFFQRGNHEILEKQS